MKYVLLLRGVNVGGNKRVPKADFQGVLEEMGFQEVVIYINSGNAVFSSSEKPKAKAIQKALEGYFGFTIPVLILPGKTIVSIAKAIPKEWTNNTPQPDKSGHKSDVLYLFDEINAPNIIKKLGYNPEIETMKYVEGAVITTISRANQSKGSLQKLVGSKLYSQLTIRNITTAKKLAEIVCS